MELRGLGVGQAAGGFELPEWKEKALGGLGGGGGKGGRMPNQECQTNQLSLGKGARKLESNSAGFSPSPMHHARTHTPRTRKRARPPRAHRRAPHPTPPPLPGKAPTFGIKDDRSIKDQRESLPIFRLKDQLMQAVIDNQVGGVGCSCRSGGLSLIGAVGRVKERLTQLLVRAAIDN